MIAIVIAEFTAMGLLPAVLHGVEAGFWAAAYLWPGALDFPGAAMLYSVDGNGFNYAEGRGSNPVSFDRTAVYLIAQQGRRRRRRR